VRTVRTASSLVRWALAVAQHLLWMPTAYLGVVTLAGALPRTSRARDDRALKRFVVLIPAHDEDLIVERAISSVLDADYPGGWARCVVLADNCTDATAHTARNAGAEVWERNDPNHPGKGEALAWAFGRLDADPDWQACTILDADGLLDPAFFKVISGRLASGASVVQCERYVANVTESRVSQLAAIGMATNGVLRLRGRSRLGGSSKLLGTGMTFSRETLATHPWQVSGLIEDAEYWFELLRAGVRPVYESKARLLDLMPASRAAATVQRSRWERGRVLLRRKILRPALLEGVRNRDAVLIEALVSEFVLPPLSVTTALAGVIGFARVLIGRRYARPALVQVAVPVAHVITALCVVRAPREVWRTLALAPAAVGWKVMVAVRARGAATGQPDIWVRTPRG
jgi:1,2-diacylglycerol 3-beta-glucosyltransferase